MTSPLLQRISENASKMPGKLALAFVGSGSNGGIIEKEMKYQDVMDQIDVLVANLSLKGLKKNDLAVLVFPPSLDFIIAFLACLKAGIVAVPVFPPHPSRKDTLLMFTKIIQTCNATYALTNSSYSHMKKLSSLKNAFVRFRGGAKTVWPENLTWIVTDTLRPPSKRKASSVNSLEALPKDLAFLQFTSGSTSDPKGVQITHENLSDNLSKITNELEANSDTIVVSWLPQYHDMGLIGSYLGTLYCGGKGYFMSPLTFIQRPAIWVEAVSKYQGTHLQAPNFAFKLTARKFEPSNYQKVGKGCDKILDLSSVRHIINAAEPVTEESIDAFMTTFAQFGLKKHVMYPTYGLAEHTVFVCSGGKQRLTISKRALEVDGIVKQSGNQSSLFSGSDASSRLVGCGFPSKQGVDVRIVSTESLKELKEDRVGEIWIRSPSKGAGYYNKVEESRSEFCALIGENSLKNINTKSVDISEGYLKSGDLGFIHKGELFVCGRMKDLIIIGGRNYYPQDLEATAEVSALSFLRPGCSAAFTVDPISGNDEDVAMLLELKEVPSVKDVNSVCSKVVECVRSAVNKEHSLGLSHIVLLNPRTIQKTTSGKIARAWCRKAFLNNTLSSAYSKSFKKGHHEVKSSLEVEQKLGEGKGSKNVEDIRCLDKTVILKRLKYDISLIISMPAESIPFDSALNTFMDSLSISQFKGLLDAQYATKISDEYLFQERATVNKLAEVVKLGYAPDDVEDFDQNQEMSNEAKVSSSANIGEAKGLAGALGCPPGVVCCIVM